MAKTAEDLGVEQKAVGVGDGCRRVTVPPTTDDREVDDKAHIRATYSSCQTFGESES